MRTAPLQATALVLLGTANLDTQIVVYQGCGRTGAPLLNCDLRDLIACNADLNGDGDVDDDGAGLDMLLHNWAGC